jgi:uncharacterized protein HemX
VTTTTSSAVTTTSGGATTTPPVPPTAQEASGKAWIAGAVIGLILLIIIAGIAGWVYKLKKAKHGHQLQKNDSVTKRAELEAVEPQELPVEHPELPVEHPELPVEPPELPAGK